MSARYNRSLVNLQRPWLGTHECVSELNSQRQGGHRLPPVTPPPQTPTAVAILSHDGHAEWGEGHQMDRVQEVAQSGEPIR
jgi:hypothetical protein